MREVIGDIWSIKGDAICIPTNGNIKTNGELVMGAGLALQAAQRCPDLPYHLATRQKEHGQQVYALKEYDCLTNTVRLIISAPTKDEFFHDSSFYLIGKTLRELRQLHKFLDLKTVLVPLLGCGLGRLTEKDVLPIMHNFLDNHFTLVRQP